VSFAAITLCVASQQVFIVVVYFVIDSVWKLLDTPSCRCLLTAKQGTQFCIQRTLNFDEEAVLKLATWKTMTLSD